MNTSQHAENLGTGGQMRLEGTCLISELVGWALTITGRGPAPR
jgi:hypothetical protein